MTTEGRRVLEVYSGGGHVIEGAYELADRAAADDFVADLAEGCGVRAKVLELGKCEGLHRREDVEQAWATTPFPPGWYVVHQQGQVTALGVYGSAFGQEAAKLQHELATQLGVDIDVSVHIHPKRPKVGEPYRPGVERARPVPYMQAEVVEGVAACEAMMAEGKH
jgi:hypothetical protein